MPDRRRVTGRAEAEGRSKSSVERFVRNAATGGGDRGQAGGECHPDQNPRRGTVPRFSDGRHREPPYTTKVTPRLSETCATEGRGGSVYGR